MLPRFQLGSGGEKVTLKALTRTVGTVTSRGVNSFRCGVQFEQLDHRLQEHIVHFVLAREREPIRQGRGV